MSGKKILMLTGEFSEEYEIFVFEQAMHAGWPRAIRGAKTIRSNSHVEDGNRRSISQGRKAL
jgi:hypothetical protein